LRRAQGRRGVGGLSRERGGGRRAGNANVRGCRTTGKKL